MSEPERERTVIKHRIEFLDQKQRNSLRQNHRQLPTIDELTPELSEDLSNRFDELSAQGLEGFLTFLGIRRRENWGWE